MSYFELMMPKLGESVQEATITKWMVAVGDTIEEDDNLLEIATDKVDSDIPSPVDGKIMEIRFEENALVPVGEVIAIIATDGDTVANGSASVEVSSSNLGETDQAELLHTPKADTIDNINKSTGKFFSPLVKNIAKKESITADELANMKGSGRGGRVTKKDILDYVGSKPLHNGTGGKIVQAPAASAQAAEKPLMAPTISGSDEIVEMDRMRKIISQYMVNSKRVSPHVTTMVEADVTNIVLWRKKVKDGFLKREKTKLTYMPIFAEAVAKAL